jgi:pyruvate/2-oxoglutarate/acetoin dehydrogenase E1 component
MGQVRHPPRGHGRYHHHLLEDGASSRSPPRRRWRRSGVSAEVVDIRCLNPFDDETFIQSVMKTGRAMVVTEAVLTSGFAAELSARISERCFDYLEEPVIRVAGEDIPIPVSPALERGPCPPRSSSPKRACGW